MVEYRTVKCSLSEINYEHTAATTYIFGRGARDFNPGFGEKGT